MQIEQDEFELNNNKNKSGSKTVKIVIALIVLSIIVVIGIIVAIFLLQGNKLSVSIDGTNVKFNEDTFKFTDSGKIYVSIKDIAPLVGYEAHNGEYKVDTEDTSKMYVEAIDGTETASFYTNSKIINKVKPNTTDDYTNISVSDPVISSENGKLYVSSEGFTVGFNSLFYYNQEKNTITIQTLPNLIKEYSNSIAQYGYTSLSSDFNNQKALIYGMIIASKEDNGKYGVITTSGTEIISPRYNKIEFVEGTNEFIITNASEKVGIAFNTGKTKINVAYDEIKLLDNNLGLYLVKSNNKYGVIDSSEKFIVHIEYDQIGVDAKDFTTDGIKNQYILNDTIIPAKLNNKWVLFNTQGKRITQDEYDSVGFINNNSGDKVVNNTVLVGDTGVVVVSKDGKYGGIDVRGNELIQIRFDGVYSITSGGETVYYVLLNGTEYNAVEYVNAIKKRLGYDEQQLDQEQNQEQEQDQEGNQNTVNNTNNANTANDANDNNTANTVGNVNDTNTGNNAE